MIRLLGLRLTASFCSGAIIGRSIPQWLADLWLGPLNATILMNVFTFLVVIVLWLPFGDQSVVVLFAVIALMGVGTGSFVPLSCTSPCLPIPGSKGKEIILQPYLTLIDPAACIFAFCEPERSGTWFGSIYAVTSLA